jgi:hypothetical protein
MKYPTVSAAEIVALTREPGPDGKPRLLPGDMIVNGCNGQLGHMSMYVGDDPKTGRPAIIHAMGTADTQQSLTDILDNVAHALPGMPATGKVGVIEEGLDAFFDRFSRDTYVVVRDPRLTDDMRSQGLARVHDLLGKGYDYDLSMGDGRYYCSELGVELIKTAYSGTSLPLPWVGTTAIHRGPIQQFVATPENFVASPDLEITAGNATGVSMARQILGTYVSGAPSRST